MEESLDETIGKMEGLLRRLKRARAAMPNRQRRAVERPSQDISAIPRSRAGTGDLRGSGSLSDADVLYASSEPISVDSEILDTLKGIFDEAGELIKRYSPAPAAAAATNTSSEIETPPIVASFLDKRPAIATDTAATDSASPATVTPPATDVATPATNTPADTAPPETATHTIPPATLATEPPATEPPATEPPATEPPATEPPAADSPSTDTLTTNTPAEAPATIKHDFEGSVLVLWPSADQWRDFPAILASARALGAGQIGAFKVVLPPELQQPLPPREADAKAKSCWRFQAEVLPNKTYRIGMAEKRQVFRRSLPEDLSAEEAVQRHESLLGSKDGMNDIYYRVDVPAETPEQRAAAGLPEKSAIWPLEGNRLSQTKYSIPGLHRPYGYESGAKFGALFGDHEEHFRLYSVSHLHLGRKLWKVIPPSAADAFARKLKETDSEMTWDCEQCLRHAAVLVPPSILAEWGIPFTIVDQRASELVVVFPRADHSGFSIGYTLAEALNFADSTWTADASAACAPECPDHPIPIEHLGFLGPGESQRRVEDLEEEEAAQERRSRARRSAAKGRSDRKHGGKGDDTGGSTGDEPATPSEDSPGTTSANMPMLSAEPTEQITQLIDHILARQFPPEWLGCAERDGFRTRLEQFLPGGCLDGLMLTKILQVLCKGSGLSVRDPYTVETGLLAIDQDVLETYDALVLPVHVNDEDQVASSAERNNWVLAVVNWKRGRFTSVGMDEALAEDLKVKMDALLNARLLRDSQELGELSDSSCGIACCLAIERYLGIAPSFPSGVPDTSFLRARYLTRLLETWISAAQLGVFAGNGTTDRSDPTTTELIFPRPDPSVETTLCASDGHQCVFLDLEGFDNQHRELASALQDGDLRLQTKARILQMVMQCSPPAVEIPDPRAKKIGSVQGLVARLKGIRQLARQCTFEERFTLVLLAQEYQGLVAVAKAQTTDRKRFRARQAKINEVLAPVKKKFATTTALERLAEKQTLMDAVELKASVDEGISLLYVGGALGYSSIATFPGTVVRPFEFVLDFTTAKSCFKLLSKPIDPTEYNCLLNRKPECDYFIKWFRILRPDLQRVAAVDPRAIAWALTSTPSAPTAKDMSQWQAQLGYAGVAVPSKRQQAGRDLRPDPKRRKL